MDNLNNKMLIKVFSRLAALPDEWVFAVQTLIEALSRQEHEKPTILCGEEEELHHLGEASGGLFAITKNGVFEKFAKGMVSPASLLGSELGELVDAILDEFSLIERDTYTYRALADVCKIRMKKE